MYGLEGMVDIPSTVCKRKILENCRPYLRICVNYQVFITYVLTTIFHYYTRRRIDLQFTYTSYVINRNLWLDICCRKFTGSSKNFTYIDVGSGRLQLSRYNLPWVIDMYIYICLTTKFVYIVTYHHITCPKS